MSMSFNTSSSSSTPTVVTTPENSILDQIAGTAAGLADNMYNWAQGAYAKTSQVTDEAVNNFFNASKQMMGLAGGMTDQYNNLFAPENAQLVQDANSYASPSRMQTDMGMAGATQAQAGQNAMRNSEQQLLSYGIDPSSGRYAALDKADQVQNSANVAGAENVQRQADINTGQQLRSQAVQVGSLLPASITNATNASTQANAGASNASLANANTGANLMNLANQYLQTAMGLKLSPVGQNSRSQGFGQSSSAGKGGGSSGSGGSGAGGSGAGGNGASGPAWGMNMPTEQTGFRNSPFADSGNQQQTGEGSIGQPQFDNTFGNNDPSALGEFGSNWPGGGTGDVFGGANPAWDPTGTGTTDYFGGQDAAGSSGNIVDQGTTNASWANGDFGNNTYDPSANQSQGWGDTSSFDGSGAMDNTNWDSNSTSSFDNYGGAGSDYSGMGDTSGSSGGDFSSNMDDTGGYAHGGAVRKPHLAHPRLPHGAVPFQLAQGGPVSPGMSPSGGAQTDDVQANLNANEFVVPKDVSTWKGEEFFHKLIADSRQKRAQMASALGTGPTMRRAA